MKQAHPDPNWTRAFRGEGPTMGQGPGNDPIELAAAHGSPGTQPFSVAVTSGKGGVGKTNLVTNLAVLMAENGLRVMLLDGDLSLANVDLLLGLPRATTSTTWCTVTSGWTRSSSPVRTTFASSLPLPELRKWPTLTITVERYWCVPWRRSPGTGTCS